jgi:hypothetical protein
MGAGFRIGPFTVGARRAARGQARRGNSVHTLTGKVTGQEPGTVLVRITGADRGASGAVIGDTIAVRTPERFPVNSAVRIRQRADDNSVVSIEPVR